MFLFGASGHCKVIIDMFDYDSIDFIIDDNPSVDSIFDIPVFRTENKTVVNNTCIIAIGDNSTRKKIANRLQVKFESKTHSRSIISRYSKIGSGTVVFAGAILNSNSIIGKHCIINTAAVVEHDCVLDDFVHISPNASLAGNVTVGEGSHIGIGATIIQGIKIGKWVTVGAGAVVINDIADYAVVAGIPARVIKSNNNENE